MSLYSELTHLNNNYLRDVLYNIALFIISIKKYLLVCNKLIL